MKLIEDQNKIFSNLAGLYDVNLANSVKRGDWDNTRQLILRGRNWIIEQVKISGLRGRGGAGFYTGVKWSFMPQPTEFRPNYLIINADESEPGTCKDRDIIRYEPHKIIEGAVIGSFAISARVCYIYIRGEFYSETLILQEALAEAYEKRLVGQNACESGWDVDIYIFRGAGAYICGEESALIESIEGKKGFPRIKPPFPSDVGLYGYPTTINNVESIAVIPSILRRGAKWFASIGKPNSTGTKIFSISGHVNKPCNVEEALGIPLRQLIEEYAGGVRGGWENLKAIIPGGSSVPLITKEIAERVTMDFDALQSVGSGLGTGGIIVMDKTTDLIYAIARFSKFYMKESCGQCSPCREGTMWMWMIMNKFVTKTAKKEDIDLLLEITRKIEGKTICAFGDASVLPIVGLFRHFREEIENLISNSS